MSETETIRGTMCVVEREEGETLEDVCKRITIEHRPLSVLPRNCTWQEYMLEMIGGYAVYNGEVYDFSDWKDLAYGDVFEATENADGTISFFLQYYNGGCGLDEAIGYALDNLKKS